MLLPWQGNEVVGDSACQVFVRDAASACAYLVVALQPLAPQSGAAAGLFSFCKDAAHEVSSWGESLHKKTETEVANTEEMNKDPKEVRVRSDVVRVQKVIRKRI